MEIEVPSINGFMFNDEVLVPGTPVKWKNQLNDHYFIGLIKDSGPLLVQITNGFIDNIIEVTSYIQGHWEIIPLKGCNDGCKIAMECKLFHVTCIPPGTIYVDPEGLSLIVIEADPFYLKVADHTGQSFDIRADVFFDPSFEESSECRLILPPLFEEELKQQASAYKAKVNQEKEQDQKYGN